MAISKEKIEKLTNVAKLYYEQGKTQNEIAKLQGVSRPLVSRMLDEAKEYGIVKIEVRSLLSGENQLLLNYLRNLYTIRGGTIVPCGKNDNITNAAISSAALEYLVALETKNLGIGWGHIVGTFVELLENGKTFKDLITTVCPLVGNCGVFNKNYHSNEIVRIIAQQTGAFPCYWHAPAFVESEQEMGQLRQLENYKMILKAWEHTDTALVNIGNYPSSPDFATMARYEGKLITQKAVGRFLCYYYTVRGEIIRSDFDYTLQIPVEILTQIKNVIGICSANVQPKSLLGALQTGIFHYILASEELVQAALDLRESL